MKEQRKNSGSNSIVEISSPTAVMHKHHVTYDEDTKTFHNLPSEWQSFGLNQIRYAISL